MLESDTKIWGERRLIDVGVRKRNGIALAKYVYESAGELTT